MASSGKVLDLLDDRYLNLQDVIGNVEPLPTLVPYEEYRQNVLVYRMDTNHEIFMALIQDFTERTAQETGRELWSWCVQWDVEEETSSQLSMSAHSPKKPRLGLDLPEAPPNAPEPQRRAPAFDIVERRVIDPELMQEEDMLRILIDIIQVDSSIVPNFIEFLYRWIDFYEGDGKALKAALRHEIPSLWDFEYHPLILPRSLLKKAGQDTMIKVEANDTIKDGSKDEMGSKTPNDRKAEELAQGSPTKKMREKPDLAAMERQTEESERLQYREVKFGIQPPKLNEPLPPLINIPRDQRKRTEYYAACFRSRQRALNLLVEAGITVPQISKYKKLQEEHPRDTPLGGEGNGLRHYHKDAQFAQARYAEKEKDMALREKHMEIAISNKLAAEALLAAHTAHSEGSSGIPLIPPTPSYERRPDMAAAMLSRILAARRDGDMRINVVPRPLVGRLKSNLFEGAKDRQAFYTLGWPGGTPRIGPPVPSSDNQNEDLESDHEEDEDTDMDDDSQDRLDSTSYRLSMTAALPRPNNLIRPSSRILPRSSLPLPPPPRAAPVRLGETSSSGIHSSNLPQYESSSRATDSSAPIPAHVTEYMRNLTPEQAQQILPLFGSRARQVMVNSIGVQTPRPAPQPHAPGPQVAGSSIQQYRITAPSTPSSQIGSRPQLNLPLPPNAATRQTPREMLPVLPLLPRLPSSAASAVTSPGMAADPPQRTTLPVLPVLPHVPTITVSPPQASSSRTRDEPQEGRRVFENIFAALRSVPQVPTTSRLESSQLPRSPPFPIAPGLSAPEPPPEFAQRLSAMQRNVPRPPNLLASMPIASPLSLTAHSLQATSSSTRDTTTVQTPHLQIPQLSRLSPLPPDPTPLGSGFIPPRPSIQRNVPSPLNLLPPPPSPLSSLAPSLLATSPFTASPKGIPIQIYFPKIVVPGNTLGPGGAKLGDGGIPETDAFLVGYAAAGSGKIVLSKAVFLPVGVWTNTLRRVRRGAYTVLETYAIPHVHAGLVAQSTGRALGGVAGSNRADGPDPHRVVYSKIAQAYALMGSSKDRENELTKRWRVSKGPMTRFDRGAVWEGWAAVLDKGIEMSALERRGAVVSSGLIDEGVEKKKGCDEDEEERERRRKEIEELIDGDEEMDSDEVMGG
ncbi:Nn.00g064840.m01.CDS01 [Neocucurbitaria sp. VM-36]